MKRFLVLAVLLATIAFSGCGTDAISQGSSINITWAWTAPLGGSPATGYYVVQEINGVEQAPADNGPPLTVTIPVAESATTRIKVAAYDAMGRMGPWSPWSDPFVEPGPPTEPGVPVRVQ